jgi:hypothetical protein
MAEQGVPYRRLGGAYRLSDAIDARGPLTAHERLCPQLINATPDLIGEH